MRRMALILLLLPALVLGATVVSSFDAPDTGITGLAWDGTSLWAVDGTTQYVYQLNPANGDVISSFLITDQTPSYNPVPGGLVYHGSTLYVAMHYAGSYGNIYRYDASGMLIGTFDVYC